MHHRALRLLPSILHVAVANAWSRSLSYIAPKPTSRLLVVPFEHARESDFQTPDALSYLLPSDSSWYWDEPSITGTPVATPVANHHSSISLVPLAKTASSLSHNLLRLLSCNTPRPSLPTLLDYHDLHPGLRSTRSYNLLLSMALRTSSYGTVKWLLGSMRADAVPGDLETWKLRVRWLVQCGWWDKAWKEAMVHFHKTDVVINGEKRRLRTPKGLPLSIWFEFFGTLRYGTSRRRRKRRNLDSTFMFPPPPSPVFSDLYSTRYHTLMNNCPTSIPHGLAKLPPKAIHFIVSTMLRDRRHDQALSLTTAYLSSLQPRLTTSRARACMGIIHLHMAVGPPSRHGLQKMYEARRTMVSLLSLNPTLRPTSTTLFVLLSPLRTVKHSGTVALNILRAFKSRYSSTTEDRRVRRRVATLALKEKRMDIVCKMLEAERGARWAHAEWKQKERVFKTTQPRRPVFKRNGREQRLWCSVIKRVYSRNRRIK